MKKLILLAVTALITLTASAYDFMVDGLAYSINEDGASVAVTSCLNYSPFSNYSGLTEASIPETVTYDGITYSVTSIGNGAFDACTDLLSVTIPNSVTIIDVGAFAECTSLTNITIPNSVTTIGGDSFAGCTRLSSITIPNSVISIDGWAFAGCISLTNLSIPNSVTTIGEGAFEVCTSMTSVTIANSVTSIGSCAFKDCKALQTIYSEINEPQNVSYGHDIFQRVNTDYCKLIVPKGTLDSYQSTAPWNLFLNIDEDSSNTTPLKGDMNGDGIIDVVDVNAIINIILKV